MDFWMGFDGTIGQLIKAAEPGKIPVWAVFFDMSAP